MSNQLSLGGQWVTQRGEVVAFADMSTTHLFYSCRTIWNHVAPLDLKIEPYKRYKFQGSSKYWRRALSGLIGELSRRDDLPFELQIQLDFMITSSQAKGVIENG